jgi:hypothetical protein
MPVHRAAPMRVSFSVDAGRIEWPHAPDGGSM